MDDHRRGQQPRALDRILRFIVKNTGKKGSLILDNLGVHHCKPGKAWLAHYKEQMAEFNLPSDSSGFNPE